MHWYHHVLGMCQAPELELMLQETKEATNYYFCYRWLLILFKREFSSYEEVSPQRWRCCYIAARLLQTLGLHAAQEL